MTITATTAPAEFFAATDAAFRAATAGSGEVVRDITIGGVRIRLAFAGEPLVVPMSTAFRHLAAAVPHDVVDLHIGVWDTRSTGVQPPRFPWLATDVGRRGAITGFNDSDVCTAFHGDLMDLSADFRSVSVMQRSLRAARFWVLAEDRVPWWERAAPLRTILHWGLRSPDRLLVHGAAVGAGGHGVLLAGAGGSGKSTTSIAALLAGLQFAGDDYVLVDLARDPVRAHSIYGTAKLTPASATLLEGLPSVAVGRDGEKAVLDVAAVHPDRLVADLALDAIVLPRVVAPGPTRLVRATAADALRALAPTTVLQLPPDGGSALGPLAALSRRLPVWHLELGGDPAAAVALVAGLSGSAA